MAAAVIRAWVGIEGDKLDLVTVMWVAWTWMDFVLWCLVGGEDKVYDDELEVKMVK